MFITKEDLIDALNKQPLIDNFNFTIDESLVVTFIHKKTNKNLTVKNFHLVNDVHAYHGEEAAISSLEHICSTIEHKLQKCNELQTGDN